MNFDPNAYANMVTAYSAQSTTDEIDCLNKANASPQVASINATVDDLNKNWQPTGYFSPDDVQKILDVFATQAADAGAALADAPLSTSDAADVKAQALDDVLSIYLDQSKNYANAIAQARAAGAGAINAPGLKHWVLTSMNAISNLYVTASVLQCRQTWVEGILDRGYNAMAAIGSVVFSVLGVAADAAYQAGKVVIQATEAALGLTAWLAQYTKWILILGLGGLAIYAGVKIYREAVPRIREKAAKIPEAWKLPD